MVGARPKDLCAHSLCVRNSQATYFTVLFMHGNSCWFPLKGLYVGMRVPFGGLRRLLSDTQVHCLA